jgi:hypothetical protein
MKTSEKRFWYIAAAIVVIGGVLFLGMLFFGYFSDEWGNPQLDERSVPPAERTEGVR